MSGAKPIGSVKLPSGAIVALGADLKWASDDAAAADRFNRDFDARFVEMAEGEGLSAGLPFGRKAVLEAARRSRGEAEFPELTPLPPGVCS